MTATYTFPVGQIAARGASIVDFRSAPLIPTIRSSGEIFRQVGGALTPLTLSVAPSGIQGWSCAATDAPGNAYVAPYASGQLLSLNPVHGGGITETLFNLPAGKSWTGLAVPSTGTGSGIAYIQASDGSMQALVTGTMTAVSPGFGALAQGLVATNSLLCTMLPATNAVGVLTLSAAASGSAASVALPMTVPSCLAGGASGVAVGGWSRSTIGVGAQAIAASPTQPGTTAVIVNPTTNLVSMLTGVEPAWSITQTISGSGAPLAVAWTPNAEQVLTADAAGGHVEVFTLTDNVLVSSQTIAVASAAAVAVTPDSLWAIIPQTSANSVAVLKNTSNTWALNQTVSGTAAAASVIATSTQEFVVGQTTALQWFRLNATWQTEATVSGLAFTPVALATDGAGTIFAVGSSGFTGYLVAVTKTGVVATASWAGSANAVLWSTGQIMVVDLTKAMVRGFTIVGNTLTQKTTVAAPAGCNGIGVTADSVWLCGTSVIDQMRFTAPFTLAPVDTGVVAISNTGVTAFPVTVALGVEHKPAAITFDASGNIWCATMDDLLLEISAAGSILSQVTIAQNTTQPVGTSIGISGLLWIGANLYACSCLNGALIQLV